MNSQQGGERGRCPARNSPRLKTGSERSVCVCARTREGGLSPTPWIWQGWKLNFAVFFLPACPIPPRSLLSASELPVENYQECQERVCIN